ncbi:XRE family transcriptional regulator [Bacteroides fragilis]
MKKKITKTLLIEPEDEKIEMVNNVIHQSIEELLVPYEKKANLSTTEATEMMEIDRSLLSKPEHGKYVSIDKLAEIITYNISFIRGNSKGRISQQEILNEITT